MKTTRKPRGIWKFMVFAAIALTVLTCILYLNTYYAADEAAIAAFSSAQSISMQREDGISVCIPEEIEAGLIFYPGGKVEYTAYEPLMQACTAEGILCVLVEMPFNLAVFDMDAAEGIQEQYPAVEQWYMGGHSLGGAMAASYLSEHSEDYAGLILLGSYSAEDLSGTELDVLSVYGSEDYVLNREKYAEYKANLPDDYTELVIDGGCHAYFGMYGPQDGDGAPTISNQVQIEITAQAIALLIG